jgi:hypothetical protein
MYGLTQRERKRQRPERLARIQEQIANGQLTVRQASAEERECWRIEREQRHSRHFERPRYGVIAPPIDVLDLPPREAQ